MCGVSTKPATISVEMTLAEAREYLEKDPTKAQVRLFLRKLRGAVDEYDEADRLSYAAAIARMKIEPSSGPWPP